MGQRFWWVGCVAVAGCANFGALIEGSPDASTDRGGGREAAARGDAAGDSTVADARDATDARVKSADTGSEATARDAARDSGIDAYKCTNTCTGSCVSGGCLTTLATAQARPIAIAANDTTVYWADFGSGQGQGAIMAAPVAGGPVTTVAAGLEEPYAIALDANDIYWTGPYDAHVVKLPFDGPPVTLAAQGGSGIAVDGTSVYWTVSSCTDGDGGEVCGSSVMTVPVAGGGTPTTLASSEYGASQIAIDLTDVYWASLGNVPPPAMMLPASILKVSKAGGAVSTLVSSLGLSPAGIAVDAEGVYYTSDFNPTGYVAEVPKGGGTPTTLSAMLEAPEGITVDSHALYWVNAQLGQVVEMVLDGGAPVTLAVDPGQASTIARNTTGVYWTDPAGNVEGIVSTCACP